MSITPTIYRWVQRYAPEMENGCAGTGVTLPIFCRGTWMKKPNQRPKGLHLDKLETLNIFGVRASYGGI